ncbi:hypothetical protein MMC13_004461 [Lambiella insularis]|nr:hypothetical protein [Lambiella insularis]
MNAGSLQTALNLLRNAGVNCVIVGELSLNYYNDVEICVPVSQFEVAELALSKSPALNRVSPSTPNLYTQYKSGFPRFDDVHGHQLVLLSDLGMGIEKAKVLSPEDHGKEAFYSHDILETSTVEQIANIPIPTLPSLVQYLYALVCSGKDPMPRIRIEQLVDGMNIDEQWCKENLFDESQAQYVLNLVNSKKDRIDNFSGNLVTCYIPDRKIAECVTRIPGYKRRD